jgi:hypothetical protein
MKRAVVSCALALLCAAPFSANATDTTPRPAPNFGIEARGGSLRSFRGQPVVLIIARNSRDKYFRRQVYRLKEMYGEFAVEKVLFVAAIQNGDQTVPSDLPFSLAQNPAQIATDYGVTGRFAVAIIGIDGNLDMITTKVIPAERIRDVVFNNFESQQQSRKPLSSQ